ncbi:neural-cadherin-like [Macrosteles quadrilineatus]|uniref:neural-cadherin-like n=1 Tax=Macrosteles quadrilineatus TaxID=74068 RepID=UPI0023E09AE1|nr:neural-cadherin-like [Macrosteles quadrilineatus]
MLYSQVVEKSGYGAEKFSMIGNVDGTGSLVVVQPLDYEDPLQRNGFRFQIQVVDEDDHSPPGSSHTALSWVVVKLVDVNDNAPQFDNPHPTLTVYEDIPTGTVLDQLMAKDVDHSGRSNIRFVIDRSSDRNRQFHVSQDGRLSVHRSLDRETNSIHQLKVLAVDDGYPPQTGSVTVTVLVEDVNDNAPRFMEEYRPVVAENDKPREILKVFAIDPDDPIKGNGPPFTFFLDPRANETIKSSFRVVQEKGYEDMAKVVSLVTFDREKQKQYFVPIVICDSGQPVKSSTNTLTVIVGDINDNPMYPGSMEVQAYVYRVQNMDIPIGRVYVEDLDDWDLPDKKFRWDLKESHRFKLNEETGELTMRSGTHRGLYSLHFKVQDRKHNQNNVKAHVRVRVRDLSYNSITNSGSLRLSGISAVDLVKKRNGGSKLSMLQTKLAEVLKVDEEHVSIFSVQQVLAHPPLTDVRFAVTNLKREVVDGMVMLHTNLIEEAVKLNITMVGVDECVDERRHCEGSCTSRLEVGGSSLVNANTTVLAGVRVVAVAECLCGALDYSRPETCRSRPCFNGGRCIEGRYGISCSCPSGFKGPRCQKTSRTFHGAGWAWYPPLSVCENSHLSFEFLARKADGQLIYNGPVGPPKPGGVTNSDFLSVELVDGYPRLLMDYGSGTIELNLTTETRLNDTTWHRLDVRWTTETVELVVDRCLGVAGLREASSCRVKGAMPPFSELLNLQTPLQLGGRHIADALTSSSYRWNHVPYGKGFDGCIRNLMCNSKLYDLAGSGLTQGSEAGCPGLCSPECEVHGDCGGSAREPRCSCSPGYQGPHCTTPTQPVTLEPHSYIKYSLNYEPDLHVTEVQLRFRTREESGELFRLGDQRADQYAVLEIVESRLKFRYKLSDSSKADLRISALRINDGQWHNVKVIRVGASVSLELDGGEGRRGNRTTDWDSRLQLVVDTEEGVYLGGRPEYTEIGIIAVEHDYQEGCIDDVRLNGRPLPLPPVSNSTVWAAALVAQNTALGCPTDKLCSTAMCRGAAHCTPNDPWNTNRCFCGEGNVLTPDGKLCVPSNDCWVKPCMNGGVCQEVDNRQQFRCVCPDNYWGDQCELAQDRHTLRLGIGAFATVLSCILVVLLDNYWGDQCELTQDRHTLRLGIGAFATVLSCILVLLLDNYWGDQCELDQDRHALRLGIGAFATVLTYILVLLLDNYWGDQCELAQDRHALRLGIGAFATVLSCILVLLLGRS